MEEVIPIAIFWALAHWGAFGKSHVLLYLFFGSMSFGAFAVIPTELTGGLTLTPTPMLALLIIMRSMLAQGGMNFFTGIAFQSKGLLLLFLFWLVAIVTTIFMPRIFEGEVMIIPVRLVLESFGEPLAPSVQNFSQLVYVTISVFTVFAFTYVLYDPVQRQHALKAICLGAAIAVFTGFIDYLNQYIPLDAILEPFRTATYSLLTEVEIFGSKRVVGLMPEASAFGGLCIGFLSLVYFFRHAMTDPWLRHRVVPVLAFLLMLFVWLSTSSGAYLSLFVFFLVAILEWVWLRRGNAVATDAPRGLGYEFWIVSTVLLGIGFVLLFSPTLFEPMITMIDDMVFSKTQSSSYEERSMWTAVGWQALIDSWGFGVGVGSTRTSNFAAAIFSNTGVIGGLLYFSFVVQTLRRKCPPANNEISRAMLVAVRCACIPAFVGGLLAGTTADFGSYNAFLYGLALAVVLHCNTLQWSEQHA